jgi:hypothetical protein
MKFQNEVAQMSNLTPSTANMIALKEWSKLYRGFEISGRAGHWYVRGESNWSTIYTSEKKARLAVDACLVIRHISAQTLYQ